MLNIILLIFLACFNYGSVLGNQSVQSKKFVIITASYNNINFVGKYLDSIFSQKCKKKEFTFRVIYCDDGSTDGTGEFVETYKKKFNITNQICLIRNKIRVGGHENIYHAIHSCDDDEIVLIVDGDDWLANDNVLEILNKVYSDSNVWLTYGQFQRYPTNTIGFCKEIPDEVIKSNSFRLHGWVSSHLRTFYAWLYKHIKMEDIMFDGKFVPVCGDLAIMFPMLEMAGMHSRFIPEVLYIYNCENPNSYWHKRAKNRAQCKIWDNKVKAARNAIIGIESEIEKAKVNIRLHWGNLKLAKDRVKAAKYKLAEVKARKLSALNEYDSKISCTIHAIIEKHIRKELAPYTPLHESDLVKYN